MTVIAVAPRETARLATTAAECARVGASVLIPPEGADARALETARAESGLLLAGTDVELRHQFSLGNADLHAVAELLAGLPEHAVPVLGGGTDVLLAALAGHAHLRVGSADTEGDDTRLVAFAAGIARLAGRGPSTPDEARILFATQDIP